MWDTCCLRAGKAVKSGTQYTHLSMDLREQRLRVVSREGWLHPSSILYPQHLLLGITKEHGWLSHWLMPQQLHSSLLTLPMPVLHGELTPSLIPSLVFHVALPVGILCSREERPAVTDGACLEHLQSAKLSL